LLKKMSKNQELQAKARKRIPGGTQLLSKRPEMFAPGVWPGYYSKANGVEIWDLDHSHYIDMSISGIGANIFGYCDPDIDKAVISAIQKGNSTSLNCAEEVELADLMIDLHPWGQMVRYTRCGGESMTLAIRVARAYTNRDKVAFCGYHGWHDWYLAANLKEGDELKEHLLPGLDSLGVPKSLIGTALPFKYNDLDSLKAIMASKKGEIAAIVMEPIRSIEPEPGFLEGVRALADEYGSVLIFDEITSGFRMNNGGAHLLYGVDPDIAVFAKGISNGYPMGIVFGRESVMQSAQSTFISSTYWTERIGPVAAIATIRKFCANNAYKKLISIGKMVQEGWANAGLKNGLDIHVSGIYPLSHFSFNHPNGQVMMTVFVQLMLERNFLASGRFYATYAHQIKHVKLYLDSVNEVFDIIKIADQNGTLNELLKGQVAHSGFMRLT
jgi:glutamate-1-semialdehyde 2,1-aminomutase